MSKGENAYELNQLEPVLLSSSQYGPSRLDFHVSFVAFMAGEEYSEDTGDGMEDRKGDHEVLDSQCGPDRVEESEMDAARTLADLAHLSVAVGGGASLTADRRGAIEGRRRSRRRLKEEEEAENPCQIRAPDPPRSQSSSWKNHHRQEVSCQHLELEPVEAPNNSEVPKSVPSYSVNRGLSNRGKAKQNLTEAEKEAKKLRRILANRESARQTIRRRQALCEELTNKASDLACDNENLKSEKELVMKEYLSLKDINKLLKAQIQKSVKEEADRASQSVPNSANKQKTSSSFIQLSTLKYKNEIPNPPCFWPCVCPVQMHFASHTKIESKNSKPNHEFLNPSRVSGPGLPICLVPHPWIYPVASCSFRHMVPCKSREADEDSEEEKHGAEIPSFSVEPKTESSFSEVPKEEESTANSIREASNAPYKDMNLMSAPLRSISSNFPDKPEHIPGSHKDFVKHHCSTSTTNIETSSGETVSAWSSVFPMKRLVVDGVMAAEARKRRKELTKLKHLHAGQHKLHR